MINAFIKNNSMTKEERKVVMASSLGTVFEWYDFYLYGSLAAVIGKHFFSGVNETTAFIFALMAFAAGFAVRPFGAIFFGRLGDLMGRKKTFLATMLIMGVSTILVGMLPGYETIGVAAPIILVGLRLLQGLALGGEYGGAATYVAEHAPPGKRGLFTSWIQTTATGGLLMSLVVILICRNLTGDQFDVWGWRIPFLLSSIMLIFSMYVRLKLNESPVFKKMKEEGKTSGTPLKDAFANKKNLKVVLFSLLGGTAGQAVVWYTGQFYALYFLTQTLKLDATTANWMMALSLLIATPFFVIFGGLSDKIGRKPIIILGMLIASFSYFPLFGGLTHAVNPALELAAKQAPVTIIAEAGTCSFQFDPVGKAKFTSPCDVAKTALTKAGVPYSSAETVVGGAIVRVGKVEIVSYDAALPDAKVKGDVFQKELRTALDNAGYPASANLDQVDYVGAIFILTLLVLFVTMVYGPIAAWLVELFPARIRYSSMSLPYHIGNGWFGGFLPTVSFAMVAATGDIYYGLWYPVVVAVLSAIIGMLALPETKDRDVHHED